MSIALISAAWRLKTLSPTDKLVLLALCDWANDDGESLRPSIQAIADKSSLSPRQAQRVMRGLVEDGWVEVIGNHSGGAPGTSRHYRLNVRKLTGTGDTSVTGDNLSRVTQKVETGDIGGGGRVTFVVETGDTGVTQTVIEPSIEPSRTKGKSTQERAQVVERPDGVAEVVWLDFLQLRRAKRSPLTRTALDGLRRESERAGLMLGEALSVCCERGWQTFRADWYAAQMQPATQRASPSKSSAHASFLALTGRSAKQREVIDVDAHAAAIRLG